MSRLWLLPAAALLAFLGLWLFFYRGNYTPPPTRPYRLEEVAIPTPMVEPFSEEAPTSSGLLVIDMAHRNSFTRSELNALVARVTARGFQVQYLEEPAEEEEPRLPQWEAGLRAAHSLMIVAPSLGYSKEEIDKLKEFHRKGGKLLLVADPSRPSRINDVAAPLGMVFENDYLYNQEENAGYFRDIFISFFADSPVTRGLVRIALYTAGSITAPGKGLAFTDSKTLSSSVEGVANFTPLVERDGVLGIADLTFMAEPFNAVLSNNRLLSNIADYLTQSERRFTLADFPHFLSTPVAIGYAQPAAIDAALKLKTVLDGAGLPSEVSEFQDGAQVFLGLFPDAPQIAGLLEAGGIQITAEEEEATSVEIEGLGEVYEEGTSLIYLHQGWGEMVILADDKESLVEAATKLEDGEFRRWLANDQIAILRP